MATEVVLKSGLRQELYLSPEYPDRESLEKAVEFWDATTAQWIGDCPRRGEYAIRYNIIPKSETIVLAAGRAIHAALSVWYTTRDADLALAELREVFGHDEDWRLPPTHRYKHLHRGHMEVVLRNYIDHAQKRDAFEPLTVSLRDLDLSDVLAAMWLITPDNKIVLGESKIVMKFMVPRRRMRKEDGTVDDELVPFIYAGKPDLPIKMAGQMLIMDHKSTNAYLSDYWAEPFRYSNQLRGYCAMLQKLIPGIQLGGAMINGIYMGEKAALAFKETKTNKFARYGPFMFQQAHLIESIRNQYAWRQTLDWYEGQGYYPQHPSKLCSGCPYAPLCEASPRTRNAQIKQDYTQNTYSFLEL